MLQNGHKLQFSFFEIELSGQFGFEQQVAALTLERSGAPNPKDNGAAAAQAIKAVITKACGRLITI
jgi:hypothetical protein